MDFSQFDLTDRFVRRALAETLAEDNGLDYQDEYIRKALNDEIAAAAAPKPIDGERNFFGDTVSRLARGGVQLADTAIHAVDTAVGGSETLQGWSDSLDKAKQNVGLLRPDKSEHEEGWLKRSYGQALESAPMSAVPWAGAMAGAKAGAALGTMALPGAGTAAGMVAGGLIGGTLAMGGLFGLGTYGQRKEEIERELTATRPDLTPDEISKMAHDNAKNHAFAETGGESAGDLASWAILSKVPGGQAIFKGGKAILAELVKPNAFKAIALGVGKSMPFEVGSEVGTAIWQNEADKAIGVEQGTSTDAALAAIGPALFLSAGMGVAVGGYSANQRRVQYNELNSEDQESRAQAVDQVAGTLAEATDQQTAKKWRDMALGFVQNGQPIPLDMNLAELSANEPEVAAPEAQDQPAETILKAESVDEAIQEAEAEIAKPGWLAPTAPDLEESAWLQQGVAAKAYNQGRNELGATPASRAGLLGQAMEPMQVASPILTETQEVEESNVGRGKVSGDQGGVAARGEQVASSDGTGQLSEVSARGYRTGDANPVHGAGVEGLDNRDQGATGGRVAPEGVGEKRAGVEQASPLLIAARQHVAETGDMTMGGLAMALDVDIDTAEKLLEQVKATTPLPRNIGGTQVATKGADAGGFLTDQAIRKTGATSPATTAGDAQGFIADQGMRKAAGAVTAATVADTEGFVRDQQIRRDAMGRGPKPTRAADEPARAFLARKREWEASVSQSGENETQAELPRTDETQAGAGGAGEMKKLVASIKKSDAKLEKLHEGQLNRMKNGGQSRATSTTYAARAGNEAKHRDGEARVLANIARAELRAGRTVPQDVLDILGSKIEYNRSGDYEPIEGVTAPSPGEASKPAAQPSASEPQRLEIDKAMNDSTFSEDGDESHRAKIARQSAAGKKWAKEMAAAGRVEEVEDIAEAHVFGFSEMQDKFVSGVGDGLSEHWQETKGKDFNPMALILSGPEKPTERDLERKKGVLARLQDNSHAKEIREKITALEEQIKANEAKIEDWSSRSYKQTGARYENREGGLSSATAANERRRSMVIEGAKIAIADANALAAEYRQQLSGVDDKVARVSGEIKVIEKHLAAQPSASKATPEKPEAKTKGKSLGTSTTQSRARAGGEWGANGEWYEGGKFIATTDHAKSHKKRKKRTGKVEIAPYEWVVPPETADNIAAAPLFRQFPMFVGKVGEKMEILPETFSSMRGTEEDRQRALEQIAAWEGGARWQLKLLDGDTGTYPDPLIEDGNLVFLRKDGSQYSPEATQPPTTPASTTTSEKPLLDDFTEGHLKKWVEDKIIQEDQDRYLAGIKAYLADHKEVIDRGHSWSKIRDLAEQWNYIKQPPTTPAQDRTPEKPAGVATSGQRQEKAAKEPWQMTREEYLTDALERNEYRDQYKANPKLLPPFEENTEREWRRSVEKTAETDRIPDAVLDSYLEKFGKQVFSSTFRGIAEKGVQGYFYPEIRAEQKAAPTDKKTAAYDLKPHERTWAQQRREERKAMGRMLTKAEWKELREQHKSAVQKALWNGEKVPASALADYPELADAKPKNTRREDGRDAEGRRERVVGDDQLPGATAGAKTEPTGVRPADRADDAQKDGGNAGGVLAGGVTFKSREDAELKREFAIDHIATIRAKGQQPRQQMHDIVAAADEYLATGSVSEGVAGEQVFGHPQATNILPAKYGNLIPIKVKDRAAVERRLDVAQALFDEVAQDIGQTRFDASKGNKRAKLALKSASFREKEMVMELLRDETMPALNRLLKQFPEDSGGANAQAQEKERVRGVFRGNAGDTAGAGVVKADRRGREESARVGGGGEGWNFVDIEVSDAKQRKDADMADVAETDFGNMESEQERKEREFNERIEAKQKEREEQESEEKRMGRRGKEMERHFNLRFDEEAGQTDKQMETAIDAWIAGSGDAPSRIFGDSKGNPLTGKTILNSSPSKSFIARVKRMANEAKRPFAVVRRDDRNGVPVAGFIVELPTWYNERLTSGDPIILEQYFFDRATNTVLETVLPDEANRTGFVLPQDRAAQPAQAEAASGERGEEDGYKPASELTREEYAEMLKKEKVGPKNKDVIRQSQDIAILRELFEDEIKEDSFARGIPRKIQDLQSGMLRNGTKVKVADEAAFNSVERGIKELFERAISEGKAVPEMILAENADLAPKEANKYEGFTFSKNDVSLEAATRAHQATSFSPDKRGQQEQEGYAGHMRNVLDSLLPLAKTAEQRAELREWFNDYYRPGYLKRLSARLSAASRTMSAMITGPAKFPTSRNQKALDVESKRTSELVEWSKKSFAKMRAKLNGSEAISSTDVDAKAKLEKKLASLVESQEMMKAANKIIKDRNLDEQGKVDAIMAAGLSEKAARAVLTTPDFMGRIGFAPHSLQNNNAEIRRIKERIAELDNREQKAEETGGSVAQEFEGGRVELNYEDGYIRIFHDAKPDKETREKLKSNGFRWTPSETAWRRKLTLNGKYAAEQVTGVKFSEAEQDEPAADRPKLSTTALPPSARADIPGERPIKLSSGTIEALEQQGFKIDEKAWEDTDELAAAVNYAFEPIPWRLPNSLIGRDRKGRVEQAGTPRSDFELTERLAKIFNKRVIWTTFGEKETINGLVASNLQGRIFLNPLANNPSHVVFGHELSHWLELEHPAIYADLYEAVEPLIIYTEEYRKRFEHLRELSDYAVNTEIIGDLMGDAFADQKFWNLVAEQAGGKKFKGIVKKIIRWINSIVDRLAGLVGYNVHPLVKDLRKTKYALARAVARYGEASPKQAQAAMGEGVRQSVRDLFKPVDTESAALSSDRDESFSLEFLPDSLMGNAEFISNLANTDTFKKHGLGGFDVPSKRIVAERMALVVKDGQILDSVVEFIPIDVVNILASEQLSPDVLLHDEAMLTDLFSGNSNQSVFFPVDVPTALVSSVALAIAKNKTGSGDLGRFSANRGTAVATGDKDLPVLGGKVTSVATENFFGVDDMAGAPFEGGPAGETLVDRHNSSPKEVYIKYNKRTKLSTIKNFPPTDPRIRYSVASASPLSWDAPLDSKKDSIIYNIQNKFIDLFRTQDAIQKHGGTITEETDVRLAEELYHKRSAKRVDDFLINEVKPLMAELAEVAQDEKEFERFLWARHAEEANESLRLRNPNAEELREMKRVALELRNTLAAKDEVKAFLAKEREIAAAKHDVETGEADDSLLVVLGQEMDEMIANQTVQEYVKTRARHEGLKKVKPFDGDNTWLSGMKDDEAKAFMRGLPQEKKTAYTTLAAKWDDLIKRTRQTLVEYELEDQETVDSWAAAFDFYIPLNREDMDGGKGIGQGFSVKGASTKGRTGSYRAVRNILANIVMQRERAIVRGEKSTISRALHGLAAANPNKDFWSIEIPPTERTVDPVTGMVVNKADMGFKSRPNVVVNRFINNKGKIEERAVVFNDQDKRALRMAEALKNLDTADLGAILGVSAKITRFFSAMNTQYNVVFGPVNLVRDVQAAALNLSTTPLKGKSTAVLKRIVGIVPQLYKAVRAENKGRPLSTDIAKAWQEMQMEGGTTGFRDMFADSNERAERLRADILQIKKGRGKRAFFALRQWVSDYNDMLENSTRLAVYMEARESGVSKKRAAQLAKDVTLNFNRKGQVATQAGAMYAFFNAAAQGTEKMYRTLTGPAGKKIITGGLLLGAAQTMLLAAAGFDEDEPPEFIRERNLILPIGGKKYLTVPMPLGFHVIPNLTRIPTEWALRGFKEPGKAVTEIAAIFAEAFNPLGNAGFSMQTFAPTPMDPFIALGENRDWTGRPIAKQDFNTLKPTPGHTRARDTASWPSEMVSRALNLLTGGNEYVPGMLSPTPDQIDYLIGQVAGGVGRETMKLFNVSSAATRGEASPAYRIPFVGRFYGNSGDMSGVASRYYTNLKRVNRIALEFDGIRENGGNVTKFIRSNPEARTIKYTEATYRNIQKLQRAKRRMLETNASRSRVEAIDRRILETMRRFNERTNQNI